MENGQIKPEVIDCRNVSPKQHERGKNNIARRLEKTVG